MNANFLGFSVSDQKTTTSVFYNASISTEKQMTSEFWSLCEIWKQLIPLMLLWYESRVGNCNSKISWNKSIEWNILVTYYRLIVIKFQIVSAVVREIFCKNKSNHIFTKFPNFNCFISNFFSFTIQIFVIHITLIIDSNETIIYF
jgi:hypothetical protein